MMKKLDYEKYKKTLQTIDENVMDFLEKRLSEELPQLHQHKTTAMLYILQRVAARVVFAASTTESVNKIVSEFAESVEYMVKAAKYEPKNQGIH